MPEPSDALGKIPLLGCPVALTGDLKGEVVRVFTYRELLNEPLDVVDSVVKSARARLGSKWTESWCMVDILLPDLTIVRRDDSGFTVLDPAQTRGARFHGGSLQ